MFTSSGVIRVLFFTARLHFHASTTVAFLHGLRPNRVFIVCVKAALLFAYIITQRAHTRHDCLRCASMWLPIDLYAVSVIGPCLSVFFFSFSEASFLLQVWGFVMMDQSGCALCVCVLGCRSDHYDWAVSLFFSLNDPALSKLHRALLRHCACESRLWGLQLAQCEPGHSHLFSTVHTVSYCTVLVFCWRVLRKVRLCERSRKPFIRVIQSQNTCVPQHTCGSSFTASHLFSSSVVSFFFFLFATWLAPLT